MNNADAIKILTAYQHKSGGLMKEAVDKAIEALERDRWHSEMLEFPPIPEPPKEET